LAFFAYCKINLAVWNCFVVLRKQKRKNMKHSVKTTAHVSVALSKGNSFGFDNFHRYMKKRKWGKPSNIVVNHEINQFDCEKHTVIFEFDIFKTARFSTIKKPIPIYKREYAFLQRKYDFHMKRADKILDKQLK